MGQSYQVKLENRGGWNRGKKMLPRTLEHRRNLSKANMGKTPSLKSRRKNSQSHLKLWKELWYILKQKDAHRKRNLSFEARKNMRENHADIHGSKHWNWKGGISCYPYATSWTKGLKRSIRKRDKYTCQICNEVQNYNLLCVHHIDHNKQNTSLINLISLCRSCHGKTIANRRYKQKYLLKKVVLNNAY
jgi:hypothetical protein